MAIKFFESPDHLEPKCPKCSSKLKYGETTKYDDNLDSHVCLNCGISV